MDQQRGPPLTPPKPSSPGRNRPAVPNNFRTNHKSTNKHDQTNWSNGHVCRVFSHLVYPGPVRPLRGRKWPEQPLKRPLVTSWAGSITNQRQMGVIRGARNRTVEGINEATPRRTFLNEVVIKPGRPRVVPHPQGGFGNASPD